MRDGCLIWSTNLWRAIIERWDSFGQMFLTQVHLQTLSNLSERCGGWIVYTESEETFVPIDEWKKKYEAYHEDSLRRHR
jgi:hypothetical protein